ncbi:hypothetical protein MASR1M74_02010 [Lentimicrobium sp.]
MQGAQRKNVTYSDLCGAIAFLAVKIPLSSQRMRKVRKEKNVTYSDPCGAIAFLAVKINH